MTVPARLREILAAARHRGLSFDVAWLAAVQQVLRGRDDRDDWRAALNATRMEWQEAWDRRPVRRRVRALVAVAMDADRVPLEASTVVLGIPLGERPCHHCGELIPSTKKRTSRYCSHGCQRAANGRRAAA